MASIADLKKDFTTLINGGGLSHAYILFGHESAAEKLEFAKELGNFLENKTWEVSDRILSDALFLDAHQGDEKGIDVVRSASQFLWQRPAVSPKRLLVIANADRLTLHAQSAILKIAEEPPAPALLLLIVKDPEVLLPAVASRFQRIFIARNPELQTPNTELAQKFLRMGASARKDFLKDLMDEIKEEENDAKLEEFVTGLIAELRKDPLKNHATLKNLIARWALIRQFNVNKKLQLEAALVTI